MRRGRSKRLRRSTAKVPPRVVRALVPPFRLLAKSIATFDPRDVQTFAHKLETTFQHASVGKRLSGIDWAAAFNGVPTPAKTEQQYAAMVRGLERTAAKTSPRYPRFTELLRSADSVLQGSPLLALSGFDVQSHFRCMCEPIDLLQEAWKSRGERRARASLRALRETCEMLYDPYLRSAALLGNVAKRRCPSLRIDKFGSLVSHGASVLTDWPGLCDSRLAVWRNAASHAHWTFNVAADAIVLWDVKTTPVSVPVETVLEATVDAWALAGPCYFFTAQLWIVRELLLKHGLARHAAEAARHLPSAFRGDSQALEELAKVWEAKMLEFAAPLRAEVARWEAEEAKRATQRAAHRARAAQAPGTTAPAGSKGSKHPAT